jgi:hypothetical protein
MLEGHCHCGSIAIVLDTARQLSELPVRVCGCSFCVRHRPRYTTDPAGTVTIRLATEAKLIRYRFGLGLADFLICGTCGVFMAAMESMVPGEPVRSGATGRAVVNLVVLDRAEEFTAEATQFTAYDSEDLGARTARRARAWTPATLVIDG